MATSQCNQQELSKSLIEKAKNELHENPDQVDAHVESLQRWVKSLPHIEFPCGKPDASNESVLLDENLIDLDRNMLSGVSLEFAIHQSTCAFHFPQLYSDTILMRTTDACRLVGNVSLSVKDISGGCRCSATYLGRTERQLKTRMAEHIPAWIRRQMTQKAHATTDNHVTQFKGQRFKQPASSVARHILDTEHVIEEDNAFCVIYATKNKRLLRFAEVFAIKRHFQKEYLLPFLRYCKYNQAEAQKRLDNFCTLRASAELGFPKWFEFPSMNDPIVEEYLKLGLLVELGRTKNDVTIILTQLSDWDQGKMDVNTLRLLTYMDHDRFMLDPAMQMAGYGFFTDMGELTNKGFMKQLTRKDMKDETKVWQEGMPLHPKSLIYYKEPAFADAIFKISEIWINNEIQKTIHRVNNDIQKAYDLVPGLKEIMPAEYGGGNAPLAELRARHAAKFREFYAKPSPWSQIKVDESKRPDSAKNLMVEYKDLEGNMLDPLS